MRRLRPPRAVALIGALAAAIALLVAGQAPANAGSSCTYPYCSETYNASPGWIVAAHDWCGNDEHIYRNEPPCGWGSQTMVVYSGQSTPPREDWDAFRVDRGYKYIVQVWSEIWGWSSVGSIDNRNGSTDSWVRVHDDQTWYILNQIYGNSVTQFDQGKPRQQSGDIKAGSGPVIDALHFTNGMDVAH
jgi:hypothetical protein